MNSAYWEDQVDPDGRLDQMMEWLAEHGTTEMAIQKLAEVGTCGKTFECKGKIVEGEKVNGFAQDFAEYGDQVSRRGDAY